MIVPFQSHINRVREALWQRPEGCASVMVGSGFCRNARNAKPGVREFPLWRELATLLCTKLYPPDAGDRQRSAMSEVSDTSGFLRLAQEYEVAFGRGALHKLIQEVIPDDDYVPDDAHVRLLGLPWRDVFTTNWDTLLERTRPLVADRAYGVVRTSEEIPLVSKPRIVKLHGSIPAHIPFIFTEEDYRTYPKRFAPFVNTVQQAMMETILLLVGFSGDDPNFLHWSGWVRDNLGKSAPKIYLAGWLDLSPHRRRMLEDRNIVPIDIARHPKAAHWPEHLHHRYATEWILHTLERGRPYDVTDWPLPSELIQSSVPDELEPVEDVTVYSPKKEPKPPSRDAKKESLPGIVRAIVRVWEHNRMVYPEWIAIPPNKHFFFGNSMYEWERIILRVIPELTPIERLSAIRELVWRRENLLEPLSDQVEAAVQAILNNIDCQARKINGIEDRSVRWEDIREAWRELAMALLTRSRQRFDCDAFERCLADLQPFLTDHTDVAQRVYQEKCLWALSSLDFPVVNELLKEWHPEGCDPAWMTRKAAILVEIGRNDEAVRLLNRSLSIVREAPFRRGTLASPSREGWMLWMALAFEKRYFRYTDETIEAPPAFRRWKELAALNCDAFDQKRYILSDMQGNPEKKDGPLFDFGVRRGKTIHWSNADYNRQISAYKAIRLCEVAGLPPFASNMVVGSDILELAVSTLITINSALGLRLVLRLANSEDDAIFNRVWTRSRIASLPMKEVTILYNIVSNVMTYALPKAFNTNTRSKFWLTRLRIAMEALSRLALRLPPEGAEDIFKTALSYYRMEGMAKLHIWLSKTTYHLIARSWEALPKEKRSAYFFETLSLPIAGLDMIKPDSSFYQDVGELIAEMEEKNVPARIPETETRWAEIIQLIIRGLNRGGEARKRAASRIIPLVSWGRLSEVEKNSVAQALWHADYTNPNTFPAETSLYDWTFLLLPEPEIGLAEQLFRKKWLKPNERENNINLHDFLRQLGNAFAGLKSYQRPLVLNSEEQKSIEAIIKDWIKLPITPDDNPWRRIGTREGIIGLQSILTEIDLSPSVVDALLSKVLILNETNTPGFRLLGGLSRYLPERLGEIPTSLRIGLSSDSKEVAEEAVTGLHLWLKSASNETVRIPVPQPPIDLISEVGVMITTRRKDVLSNALQFANLVFTKGSNEQREAMASLVLNGLRYLLEELRYDRDYDEDGDAEVPLLRWGCVHLAFALSASGYGSDQIVTRWIEVAQNDPLPEVRHAEKPVSVFMRAERPIGQ